MQCYRKNILYLFRRVSHAPTCCLSSGFILSRNKDNLFRSINFAPLCTRSSSTITRQNEAVFDFKDICTKLEKIEKLPELQLIQIMDHVDSYFKNKESDIKNKFFNDILCKIKKYDYPENVYKNYVKICNDNRIPLNVDDILQKIQKPSFEILKQLLENTSGVGNISESQKVLLCIKNNGYAANEEIFNLLAACYTIQGGVTSGESILKTMQMAKIPKTDRTYFALINALAQRNDPKSFLSTLEKYQIRWDSDMLLKICETLGFSDNFTWIKYVLPMVDFSPSTDFLSDVESLCLKLIDYKHYDSAIGVYKLFFKKQSDYAFSILKRMLFAGCAEEKLIEVIDDLEKTELNVHALRDITFVALESGLFDSALRLFKHFKVIKPHFYWPILIRKAKTDGETGIMETLLNMSKDKVKFDSESLILIIPLFDLSDPNRVLNSLQTFGYSVRELLTPMLAVLLDKGKAISISDCCKNYKEVNISNDHFIMESLSNFWIRNANSNEICITILKKVCESNSSNELETLLIKIVDKIKTSKHLKRLSSLLKAVKETKLKLSNATTENLINTIKQKYNESDNLNEVEESINDLIDFSQRPSLYNLHPKDMNVEQLECHLEELKAKQMNTRGVVRKLIQKHTGSGNLARVKELEEELHSFGHSFSPGMLSSLLSNNVRENNPTMALDMYERIKINYPGFTIDSFKIVDLAGLLCRHGRMEEAMDILRNEKLKRPGGKSIERNCRELLSSINNVKDQLAVFDILLDNKYCVASNYLLGAIMELHIEKDTLTNAVAQYQQFAKKFFCTPLQFKLLCLLIEKNEQGLIDLWSKATESVHGKAATLEALISGYSEMGNVAQILLLLKNCKVDISRYVNKRCDRWVKEGKVDPLKNFLTVGKSHPKVFTVSKIHLSIIKIYSNNNDCESAVNFSKGIISGGEFLDNETETELNKLLKRCKYDMPKNSSLRI